MKILALETSTFTASVALLDGEVCTVRERGPEGAHSSDLLDLVGQVLADSDVPLATVDAVAVGAGPGSFTGLRIAMATAKGLAFAAGKPLLAVSSLAALALDAAAVAPGGTLLVPLIDARRGELFAGFFRATGDRVVSVGQERVVAPADLAAAIAATGVTSTISLFGDGVPLCDSALVDAIRLTSARATPSAASVARLASIGQATEGLRASVPTYLRAAAAEVKFPTGSPGGTFVAGKN